MQAFPTGMELFPSANDEQWEFIKREIASSDYYVVIVAGKYGSLAPDGTSFTEKEYDYAVQVGKPVMGFLFHDLGEIKGNLLESDPGKRRKLEDLRTKIAQGKLIKHYRNADELKALVLHALLSGFRDRPQTGWIRADTARRVDDLERIAQLQQEIMRLVGENAALREAANDQRRLLSQGVDPVKWTLRMTWVTPDEEELEEGEPVDFDFESTWDELLFHCFRDKNDRVSVDDVYKRLKRLITRKAIRSGHGDRWVIKYKREYSNDAWARITKERKRLPPDDVLITEAELKVRAKPIPVSADLTRVKTEIQLQFQALDYVNVIQRGDTSIWALSTPRGLLHLGLLAGKTRSSA